MLSQKAIDQILVLVNLIGQTSAIRMMVILGDFKRPAEDNWLWCSSHGFLQDFVGVWRGNRNFPHDSCYSDREERCLWIYNRPKELFVFAQQRECVLFFNYLFGCNWERKIQSAK